MKNPTKRGTGARKPKPDDPEQSKRFEDTARELAADEGEKTFRDALQHIVPKRHDSSSGRKRN